MHRYSDIQTLGCCVVLCCAFSRFLLLVCVALSLVSYCADSCCTLCCCVLSPPVLPIMNVLQDGALSEAEVRSWEGLGGHFCENTSDRYTPSHSTLGTPSHSHSTTVMTLHVPDHSPSHSHSPTAHQALPTAFPNPAASVLRQRRVHSREPLFSPLMCSSHYCSNTPDSRYCSSAVINSTHSKHHSAVSQEHSPTMPRHCCSIDDHCVA